MGTALDLRAFELVAARPVLPKVVVDGWGLTALQEANDEHDAASDTLDTWASNTLPVLQTR